VPLLEVKGVTRRFGVIVALEDVSFDMYLALVTFAVATPAVLKEYSGFTGGVSGKALPLHSND
jgi:ABC-type phosphonate transport system ATPase subunit